MNKIAIIVETRKHKALNFVLENVMSNLPNEWKLQIFHGLDNLQYIKNIIDSNSFLQSIKFKITFTNLNIKNLTQEDSSQIMLSENFWESVNGETVLYWGNRLYPLNEPYPVVMNGGVSIRKRKFMLDIIKNKWKSYIKQGGNPCEDYFVSACVTNKPTTKQVLSFSIDCGYIEPLNNECPFAIHKPWGVTPAKGHGRSYNQLKQICPDIETLKNLQGEEYV
jgi:hypothetical protein